MQTILNFFFRGVTVLEFILLSPMHTHVQKLPCAVATCVPYTSRHPLLGPGNTVESCQPRARTSMEGVKTLASALGLSVVLKVACSKLGPFVSPLVFEGLGGVDRAGSSLPVGI